MDELKVSADIAFGLAFNVERDPSRRSGFRPARTERGAGKELFSNLRLRGFAAALTTGFARSLFLVGGDESLYKNESPVVNRAESIRRMLVHDFDIQPAQVFAFPSRSNTRGNIDIIAAQIKERGLDLERCCLITNHYHLPRANNMLADKGLYMRLMSAEALWLLAVGNKQKNKLIEELGGGPLAERDAEEIQGMADMVRGTYQPRTDVHSAFKSLGAEA